MLAVCLGCGLLVERVAGWRLAGAVLPSVGLGLVIVCATLTTSGGTVAPATTWIVLALAIAGYAVSWPRVRALRPEPLAAAVGLGVFAVCAAPVVLSGNAGVSGYFVDNDPAYHMALIDWLTAHGPSLASLPANSAYWQILNEYISSAYPVGADLGLGALRPLVGQDVAWIFSPYLATIMALGAVAIYELLRDAVRSRWLRAACAFVAAQPALAYAFYLGVQHQGDRDHMGDHRRRGTGVRNASPASGVARRRAAARDGRRRAGHPRPRGRAVARDPARGVRGLLALARAVLDPAHAADPPGAVRGGQRDRRCGAGRSDHRQGVNVLHDRDVRAARRRGSGKRPRQPPGPALQLAVRRDLAGRRLPQPAHDPLPNRVRAARCRDRERGARDRVDDPQARVRAAAADRLERDRGPATSCMEPRHTPARK